MLAGDLSAKLHAALIPVNMQENATASSVEMKWSQWSPTLNLAAQLDAERLGRQDGLQASPETNRCYTKHDWLQLRCECNLDPGKFLIQGMLPFKHICRLHQ